MAKLKAFNTGMFSEKVLALSNYDSTIITNLYQNPANKQKITRGAAFIIKNYFDQYLDQRARQTPSAYHHVYEFNKTGKYLLYKPKFGSEVPDYVLIDEEAKIIYVYEVKVNLRNMDSKKAHGEKSKYLRLKLFLEENYKNYKTSVFVVNFLGVDGRNCCLYKNHKSLKY